MFAGYFITFNHFECCKFELTSMHKVPTGLQLVDMWHLSLLPKSEVWFKQRIVGCSIIYLYISKRLVIQCFVEFVLKNIVLRGFGLWLMFLCFRGLWWVWFIVKLQASGHANVNDLLLAITVTSLEENASDTKDSYVNSLWWYSLYKFHLLINSQKSV